MTDPLRALDLDLALAEFWYGEDVARVNAAAGDDGDFYAAALTALIVKG